MVNGFLIIAGAMLICFADREMSSVTFTSGTRISIKYPFFGSLLIIAGIFFL